MSMSYMYDIDDYINQLIFDKLLSNVVSEQMTCNQILHKGLY